MKVLQVLHRNSVHNLVISGEASKKLHQFSSVLDALYHSIFSGGLLFPKVEYKNANDCLISDFFEQCSSKV